MMNLREILLLVLPAFFCPTDGHFLSMVHRCQFSSVDDMVYIMPYRFNMIKFLQYNSTLGKYEGYTELGIKNAERMNNDPTILNARKAQLETFCKNNARVYYQAVYSKTVEPEIEVKLIKQADRSHPARLMCSAYSFYPPGIKVTWLKNGEEVKGDVTSTEEMANGDWYYQIHSDLEYMPKSGEEISCMVEHASFKKPMIYKWDPSMPEGDRSKIAIGASGLVLGVVLIAAGFIYYKKKSSGRILVPT